MKLEEKRDRRGQTEMTHVTSVLSSTSLDKVSNNVWNSAIRFWDNNRNKESETKGASLVDLGKDFLVCKVSVYELIEGRLDKAAYDKSL